MQRTRPLGDLRPSCNRLQPKRRALLLLMPAWSNRLLCFPRLSRRPCLLRPLCRLLSLALPCRRRCRLPPHPRRLRPRWARLRWHSRPRLCAGRPLQEGSPRSPRRREFRGRAGSPRSRSPPLEPRAHLQVRHLASPIRVEERATHLGVGLVGVRAEAGSVAARERARVTPGCAPSPPRPPPRHCPLRAPAPSKPARNSRVAACWRRGPWLAVSVAVLRRGESLLPWVTNRPAPNGGAPPRTPPRPAPTPLARP